MSDIVKNDDVTITETLCETLSQVTLWPGESRTDLPTEPGRVENGKVRSGRV